MGSITREEKDRLKAIIADTVTLLCKNGLNTKFKREFTVEGLIGITLDKDDLLIVPIKELVENPNPPVKSSSESETSGDENSVSGTPHKRKRKRKKPPTDEATPSKTSRGNHDSDSDNDDQLDTSSTTPAKFNQSADNTNLESNDSFFTLHDIKHDHSDDDLIEIIKEEPGLRQAGNQQTPHIVSIQSMQTGGMVSGAMGGMGSPPGSMIVGTDVSGTQMAPGQYQDLMQQVELIPGSGVYIKKATYNQLQFIDKGSKLVRKLVREIFPDVHLLASSSCMGKGETSAGLDRHKVEVIKEYAQQTCGMGNSESTFLINVVCSHYRGQLRKKGLLPQKDNKK